MKNRLNYALITGVLTAVLSTGTATAFWGDKKDSQKQIKEKVEANIKEDSRSQARDENKLVQLDSLEASFLKSVRLRRLLAVNVLNLQKDLKQTDDAEKKKEITENMEKAQKQLEVLNVAMDVVFSPTQPRQYEYNPVKSTIYVKVGNIEQVFIRAVQVRDGLLKAIQEQRERVEATKDEKEKQKIQKSLDNLQRQYQTVVASLQLVFDIVPQRNYLYNPKDSTLYLKVTEDEAKKIQEKINKMSQQNKKQNGGENGK